MSDSPAFRLGYELGQRRQQPLTKSAIAPLLIPLAMMGASEATGLLGGRPITGGIQDVYEHGRRGNWGEAGKSMLGAGVSAASWLLPYDKALKWLGGLKGVSKIPAASNWLAQRTQAWPTGTKWVGKAPGSVGSTAVGMGMVAAPSLALGATGLLGSSGEAHQYYQQQAAERQNPNQIGLLQQDIRRRLLMADGRGVASLNKSYGDAVGGKGQFANTENRANFLTAANYDPRDTRPSHKPEFGFLNPA